MDGCQRTVVPDEAAKVSLQDEEQGENHAADHDIAPRPELHEGHRGRHDRQADRYLGPAGVHSDPAVLVVLPLVDEEAGPQPLEQDEERAEADHDAEEAARGTTGTSHGGGGLGHALLFSLGGRSRRRRPAAAFSLYTGPVWWGVGSRQRE